MSDASFSCAAVDWRHQRDAAERLQGTLSIPTTHQASYIPAYTKGLKVLDGAQLLSAQFPRRGLMLSPWLPEKGLTMLYAPRGVGKTWIALGIAHAVASGSEFLRWRAPSQHRVVYIDGEMPAVALQERYTAVVAASDMDAPGDSGFLQPICRRMGYPTLRTRKGNDFMIPTSRTPTSSSSITSRPSPAVSAKTRQTHSDRFRLGWYRNARPDDPFSWFTMPAKVADNGGRLAKRIPWIPSSH
jgi:AAA domain